ncbi:MAG: DUF2130 domain-containing protein [Dehalococcoidia bacterium]|nr:DUF2130 domain-containing protein [Dehalococcoidia bacterium]
MADEIVKCPNCGFNIPISEVLTHQIRDRLKSELESGVRKREASLLEREKQLSQAQKTVEEQVAAKLKTEISRVHIQEARKIEDRVKVELDDLKCQVAEKEKRIAEHREAELELRKKARELEERKQAFELEMTRKMDTERDQVKQEALSKFTEEHRLKDAEKEKLIRDLKQALEDAQRRAAQGSMQTQGEVQELDLENILKTAFPFDDIQPVPKGIRGADVVQNVFDSHHKPCGIILWEAKHTKHWSDAWLQKLKDDQREIGANISVLVTEAMPKEVEGFSLMDGVWVTRFNLSIGLATALRANLVDLAFARTAEVGKNEKMEALYQYLSGPEFSQKIRAIGETFDMMQQQLSKEKRAMEKIWKEREKHIQRIAINTARMYGDMRGIIGASLPEVAVLELGPIEPRRLESGLEDEP